MNTSLNHSDDGGIKTIADLVMSNYDNYTIPNCKAIYRSGDENIKCCEPAKYGKYCELHKIRKKKIQINNTEPTCNICYQSTNVVYLPVCCSIQLCKPCCFKIIKQSVFNNCPQCRKTLCNIIDEPSYKIKSFHKPFLPTPTPYYKSEEDDLIKMIHKFTSIINDNNNYCDDIRLAIAVNLNEFAKRVLSNYIIDKNRYISILEYVLDTVKPYEHLFINN